MAITREKKEQIVNKIKDIITSAKTIVFIHFKGVTSEEANDLRTACADENVGYFVAKKTLIKKAFEDAKIEGEFPDLDGEIAIAYGDDMLAPAQVLGGVSKKLEGRVEIVGGVYEDKFEGIDKMKVLSNIPPIKVLYAQFLSIIKTPISQCASVFSQIADKKN